MPGFGLRDVSRETQERLEHYAQALLKWSSRINLVAKATHDDVWTRHIEDSVQIFSAAPVGFGTWCDLGSGGGLPGLVVAILCREHSPNCAVTLIESDARKAAFLSMMARELDLKAMIIRARIESASPCAADIVSARALAPLPKLLGYVDRHLAPGGTALLPKGRNHAQEVEEARKSWRFDVQRRQSCVDPDSVILVVNNLLPMEIHR